MASSTKDSQDRYKLFKFTKILTLKVAQVVVQSRQGKKVTHPVNYTENLLSSSSSNLQWFNLSIPDEPEVNSDATQVLNGEVVDALSKTLCIEISLQTADGDEMVLEIWSVKMIPGCDMSITSISTIYYRMGIMLKSTLSISRITPAYKMSRLQNKESYKIYHKIFGGSANLDVLGENAKNIKVSELRTPIGTILIEVVYRTKMTIIPEDRQKSTNGNVITSTNDIMVKSDHFRYDSPKKTNEKKEIDLSKPLTAGAFVDAIKIQELHEALSLQLPPEPPMTWLLAEKEKMETKIRSRSNSDMINANKPGCSKDDPNTMTSASRAIEVPKTDRYSGVMEFPFADGSPITELANFYQECLQARSASDEWTEVIGEHSASTDSESLSQQLKLFEEAVPEFDSMVASMFSNSDQGSDNS